MLCQVSQRHRAALCKLYNHPWAVVHPQFPLTSKPRVSCPSWGPGAFEEGACGQRSLLGLAPASLLDA